MEVMFKKESVAVKKSAQNLNECVMQVGAMAVSSEVNGPGRRLVIWLQGCPFNCKGCFNPEFRPMEGGKKIKATTIMEAAFRNRVEGLTFTGGEPFMQAQSLSLLARAARREGFGIVCYTGFYWEQLQQEKLPGALELLANIDLLIDGPFEEELQGPFLWRGSSNQGIRCLSSRYKHEADAAKAPMAKAAQIVVGSEKMLITGIFPIEFWEKLEAKLR